MWLLGKFFERAITRGELTVIEADGTRHRYGAPAPGFGAVTLRFNDPGVQRAILRSPVLGAGEAFMDGRIAAEDGDIRDVINLLMANDRWDGENGRRLYGAGVRHRLGEIRRWWHQRNHETRSKRNVAHHYDLDGRLYSLFLDADRQYSCAYFTGGNHDLDQAQLDKKAHIAAKLALAPGQRVLDIGCGWGGMALYLNRVADVDVLGVTLSQEQLAVARRRAEEAGVADRVRFELIDYRKVEGTFDRIVSVGMFEHVGVPQYDAFFAKCASLLASDGVMLIHTIGRMGGPSTTDAWTEKYIFPGGYSPALSEIVSASEKSRLIVSDVETLRLHYAETIDRWYDRVVAHRAQIEALYDARFFRMWTYYLAGAASAFRFGDHCNYQLQYIRRREALPFTRDYMAEAEGRLQRAAYRLAEAH